MPAWLAPAIGVAAGLFGGERANRTNRQEAEKNRNWQTREADINRKFQERMRNTEWQAAVADMHAAGINPALAYSQGGASAPGGSMGGGATASAAENTSSSAVQAASQAMGLRLMKAQLKKTDAEAAIATENEIIQRATRGLLTNEDKGETSLLARQLRAAIVGAEATNDLTSNRAQMIGPQSAIMQQIERALQPILSSLSNAGGAAMNRLRQLSK